MLRFPFRERGSSIADGEHEFEPGGRWAGAKRGGIALAKQRFYGLPNPDYDHDALWLAAFMEKHAASQEKISHILGVNVARVWEWRHRHMPLPIEAKRMLIQWASDGCP